MSTLTIVIPSDISETIAKHGEIDWQSIAQKSLIEYAQKLALTDVLTSRSALTEEDAAELDVIVKDFIAQKYK